MNNPTPSSEGEKTPTELDELRQFVQTWLTRATKSLEEFFLQRYATFVLDTDNTEPPANEPFNTTTTARAYKAMVSALWRMHGEKALKLTGEIATGRLNTFLESRPYFVSKDTVSNVDWYVGWPEDRGPDLSKDAFDKCRLNNFDVVHLTDYIYAHHYLERYQDEVADVAKLCRPVNLMAGANGDRTLSVSADVASMARLRDGIIGMLTKASERNDDHNWGKIPLVPPDGPPAATARGNTYHFFVTLHALRALSILNACSADVVYLGADETKEIVQACKRFCMEQCFYASRGNRHEFDCTSLVFALVIYVSYAKGCDKDLVSACLDAISRAQTTEGSWPATHPIIRKGGKPWHITSHELALSLSWLYFEPQLPDSGRNTVLEMLEKYFKNWVMKTHVSVEKTGGSYSGWFDDHTISRDFAAGWVTAIVCDFLGNYHNILCDRVNRRVIETLGMETSARDYLIDEDATGPATKWRPRESEKVAKYWPDLPPLSWPTPKRTSAELSSEIAAAWTDPERESENVGITHGLAKIIEPIVNTPRPKFPDGEACLFLLPGPPGTRKTSLVKSVPGIAKWPLITVPAATFFEDGFDHLLTRATHVFRNLGYLRKCVIFFDEFEEFFRERFGEASHGSSTDKIIDEVCHRIRLTKASKDKLKQARMHGAKSADREFHDRTIAAFITSSMLPHLQNLHDEGRCLVFVATNSESTIDRAIQRPGRFDLRIEVPHPTLKCLTHFLDAPTKRNLEDLKIGIPDGAKTGLEFAMAPEWAVLATEMKSIFADTAWRRLVIDALIVELAALPDQTDALTAIVTELKGVDVQKPENFCVPFRDLEEALRVLKANAIKPERARLAVEPLKRPLDDQVPNLKLKDT